MLLRIAGRQQKSANSAGCDDLVVTYLWFMVWLRITFSEYIYTNIHIQYVCIYPAVYINTTVVQKHVQEQGRQPPRRTHLHKRLNDRKSYMMPGIVDSSRSLGIFAAVIAVSCFDVAYPGRTQKSANRGRVWLICSWLICDWCGCVWYYSK